MQFKLEVREHEELGTNGVVVLGDRREYFEPATGLQLAHDLLEHPLNPHQCGWTDELMALGGIVFLRFSNGMTGNSHVQAWEHLTSDLYNLARSYQGECFVDSHSGSRCIKNDDYSMELIDRAVDELPKYWKAEEGEEELNFNPGNIRSWMVKGYQLAAKRYKGLDSYTLAYGLFKGIQDDCDRWLKNAELGDRAILQISLTNYACTLTNDYDEYQD